MTDTTYSLAMHFYRTVALNTRDELKTRLLEFSETGDLSDAVEKGMVALWTEGHNEEFWTALRCLENEDSRFLSSVNLDNEISLLIEEDDDILNQNTAYNHFIRALETAQDIKSFLKKDVVANREIIISSKDEDYDAEYIIEMLHDIITHIDENDFIGIINILEQKGLIIGYLIEKMASDYLDKLGMEEEASATEGVTLQKIFNLLKPHPDLAKEAFSEGTLYDDEDGQTKILLVLKDEPELRQIFCEVAGLDEAEAAKLVRRAENPEWDEDELEGETTDRPEDREIVAAPEHKITPTVPLPETANDNERLRDIFAQAKCKMSIRLTRELMASARDEPISGVSTVSLTGRIHIELLGRFPSKSEDELANLPRALQVMQGQPVTLRLPKPDFDYLNEEAQIIFSEGAKKEIAYPVPDYNLPRFPQRSGHGLYIVSFLDS